VFLNSFMLWLPMFETIILASVAFVTAFINNALGGGYGTISGPILLLLGYSPQSFIPAILFSEAISEYWAGAWHIRFRNVNGRAFGLTIIGGTAGIATAILLVGLFLATSVTRLYIGVLTFFMGLFVIFRSLWIKTAHCTEGNRIGFWRTILLGYICGFNKSGSGGGFGPLSTTGYILMGLPAAVAIGTTILTKATASLFSIIGWATLRGIDWRLTIPMSIGAFLGAPIAAWLNNYFKINIHPRQHERVVGLIMTMLGAYSIAKQL
jgi:uncharacterized protein